MTVRRLSLDTSHWTGQGHLKGKTHNWTKKIPLSKILVVNSQYVSSSNLKRRLLREGVLEYLCSKCGITTWNEEPIILQLDHINGDNLDHRKENLRLLCPNCHSQTQTFAGRNIKKRDCHSTTWALHNSNQLESWKRIEPFTCVLQTQLHKNQCASSNGG